ncbi:group 1 glycosyl transferase : Slr1066 protein OS=Synechocystis sp. (strain PCC 6803 / Kazusa) GN=slr1066 PE=4 SV=1: Glycos_transf_1 [Gemmataceae bacterium]|nr:group 1 glycosyl transferase : Slr1066 protein OS=Synechocystis sp. (strain PCC 6803 / Kazusa) GN=slr1066 PE=4 SV=1: Glycos_transf_1 [Gemmataceae bacterium]VTU00934.1 group 1 glycosyl transferase : Slr1066 protein OS=Synechocystis sp. (strain PCC 6803 / Kazusa) GN=slr1066 PE=4 SV=1: Glycos_transf_1 [Gemmataceae bacterium]
MRILLCCPVAVDPKYGAAKVYIEVAAAFQRLGWDATLVGPEQVGAPPHTREYQVALREYLRARAAGFDVVEYEHDKLPFPRASLPAGPLFVARSVLLIHNVLAARIPLRPGVRAWVGHLLYGRSRRRALERIVADATVTCREADLVNVPTTDDRDALVRHGIDPARIVVFPYALTAERRAELGRATPGGDPPTIAFVGTFDPRKGMRDFPAIVAGVCDRVPDARFRLIGTRGMLPTAAEVLAVFPRRLRDRIAVTPTFQPSELPALLSGCSAGVFPSAVEGFPFGVLEMLAAGLPVVAYRVPGPTAILSDEFLVPRGHTTTVTAKLVQLLTDANARSTASDRASASAGEFCWDDIARQTTDEFQCRIRVATRDTNRCSRTA